MQTSYTQTAEDRSDEEAEGKDKQDIDESKNPKSEIEPSDKEEVVDKEVSEDPKQDEEQIDEKTSN